MAIRLSGMTSGLDTEAIVKAMVTGYNQKKEKYQKAQTKLGWQQDAWKSVNSKVYSLYSSLDSLRFSSGYSLKKTTVSDSSKVKVSAGSSAFNGSQKLKILSTAKSGNMTGAKLESGTKGSTTLAELGYTGSNGKIDVTMGDGSTKSISVDASTTVNKFVSSLQDAGLSANFDESQGRIYINSKKEGAAADFSLTGANTDGFSALTALGVNIQSSASDAAYAAYSQYAGVDAASTKANIESALSSYKNASESIKLATAQNSNLTSSYSYINAYKGMRETFDSLGLDYNNDTTGKVSKLRKLFDMTQTEVNTSIMDEDGNIYSRMDEKDVDGNPMYKYTDAAGNETIVTAITSYTADAPDGVDASKYSRTDGKNYYDGHELKSTSEKDEDGRTKFTYKDDDGNEQEVYLKITAETNYFTGASAYEETETGEDGTEKTVTKYSVAGTPASGMNTPAKLMNNIKESLADSMKASIMAEDPSLSDEDASEQANTKVADLMSKLQGYVNQVDAFEQKKQDDALGTKDSPGEYSTWDIASKVAAAYDSGDEGAMDALSATFTAQIQSNKTAISDGTQITDQYANLKALSEKEVGSDEYNELLDSLVERSLNAKEIEGSGAGYNTGAAKVDGSDAKIVLGGIEYTSSSNSFNINGLSIQTLAETGDDDENAITITTQSDTQGLYDKVKDFISTYNDIINELTELYNAPSSKGYEPLTDDERAEMSDKQIEQWETKIKDSLLRRDQTLGGIISTMTSAMSGVYPVNGKNYSLSSFGIKTQGILSSAQNKQNAYHIDGDEDDSVSSANTDKLMAALTGDPDTVTSFLQKLTNGLHDSLDKKMRGTTMRSAYTVYNDKEMAKEYSSYNKLIKQWETRAADAENRYYKQFTSMEKALTQLQTSTSSITGMLG